MASNFDLCSTLTAVRVLYRASPIGSVYNGYLRGPVTLTPIAQRFEMKLSLPTCFYDLGQSQLGFEHPTLCLRGERFNPLRRRRSL